MQIGRRLLLLKLELGLLRLHVRLRLDHLRIGLRRRFLAFLRLGQVVVHILDTGGNKEPLDGLVDVLRGQQIAVGRRPKPFHHVKHALRLRHPLDLRAYTQTNRNGHVHLSVPRTRVDLHPLVTQPDDARARLMLHQQAQHHRKQPLDARFGEDARDHLGAGVFARHHLSDLGRGLLLAAPQRVRVNQIGRAHV